MASVAHQKDGKKVGDEATEINGPLGNIFQAKLVSRTTLNYVDELRILVQIRAETDNEFIFVIISRKLHVSNTRIPKDALRWKFCGKYENIGIDLNSFYFDDYFWSKFLKKMKCFFYDLI